MELRQLRYFVTLAEELHFGRAAAREHIVQSALSQRLQRLEREIGVTLMDRTTHHVRLTAAGAVFLIDARQILAHVERAAVAWLRSGTDRGCAIWSFGNCATSSPSPRSCISVGPPHASTLSSPR